jgi:PTH1 family peptidyl-tRNA hydrolase
VICDDLALRLGALRIRARGSAGGQNGLASVIETVGGEEFPRVRVGVGPRADVVPAESWADYVLAPFAPQEEPYLPEMIDHAATAVLALLESDAATAGAAFNRRRPPPPCPGLPPDG